MVNLPHAPPLRLHPQALVAQCLDHIALEGRAGVALPALFDVVDPLNDGDMRRQMWQLLKRQQARGILQFFYRANTTTHDVQIESKSSGMDSGVRGSVLQDQQQQYGDASSAQVSLEFAAPPAVSLGKKRKRPTSSSNSTNNSILKSSLEQQDHTPSPTKTRRGQKSSEVRSPPSTHGEDAVAMPARTATDSTSQSEANPDETHLNGETDMAPPTAIPHADNISDCTSADPNVSTDVLEAMALEDAVGPHGAGALSLAVAACPELRFRALNAPIKAILADLGEEHLLILEAVGRARTRGASTTELAALLVDGKVKRLHNALDTLISYNLVVKRMMIVSRPTMRRMNIIHLPRFAADFSPHMFDESAEFEFDEGCKKIICAAAEAYLQKLPTQSCVLTDLGRDLNLHKRHLEILRSHIMQEAKKDEHYHLELFQAVLRPTKKAVMEPKILNCIRYKPHGLLAKATQTRRGIAMEMGLLHQIYNLIEDAGDHGATIVEMRNQIVLPGSKLPYKLVSILAGTYGLRAETIILGKNKAFRLFLNSASATPHVPRLASHSHATAGSTVADGNGGALREEEPSTDALSVRANLTLKDALGGVEVYGTRARRRNHILRRLEQEKIISLSSLRASVFGMEKQVAEAEANQSGGSSFASQAPSAVGMVDTRSISRIAEELEREGSLRLLQLPLPAKNVSTKFRALKCVVFPGYENDEQFIQRFVKNYCRDERLRRINQNTERNQVIRLRTLESEDELGNDVATQLEGTSEVVDEKKRAMPRSRRKVKRRLSAKGDAASLQDGQKRGQESSDGGNGASESGKSASKDQQQPNEISYRIRRFVSQAKSGAHNHQYRTLGFAYGVMYRCKVFHKFLWTFLHDNKDSVQLRDEATDISIDDDEDGGDPEQRQSGIVFSRETVLHSMPVHLYIQAFSGGEVLSPTEVSVVEEAIANKRLFSELPDSLRDKIWSHESQRTAKVLGTLTDLNLINPHKIGMNSLIKILRAGYTDGRDGVLSRALKDNALGGLFRLRNHVRILLDDKNGDHLRFYPPGEQQVEDETRKRVNALNELRLVGTTEKSYSFSNLLPLRFAFDSEVEVDRYWEALECLCLEQMVMEVSKPKRNEPAVCEVPKPTKTRARRMLRILAWISKSRKTPPKAADGDAGSGKSSKRAEKRSGIVSKSYVPRLKRRQTATKDPAAGSASNAVDDADEESHPKPHRSTRRRNSAHSLPSVEEGSGSNSLLWTEENERNLLAFFIENCKTRWKISIPLGLQRDSEQVAFRNPTLSRSGFGLVTIARKLGKRRIDVKKRLKEKLMEPAAKLLFEQAKRETTLIEHPSGIFDEEVRILQSARLTALFRRAVMMVVSPQTEYHPLVAEELISFWSAQEIRLVWRYLWLKNWIVRATEKEKVRGYTTSQRLQDFLKLTTLSYPLWLFRQAAEQESMINSTLDEITNSHAAGSAKARGASASVASFQNSNDQLFEAEFPTNATPGQCALELGCQVMGTCSLTATHSPMDETDDDGMNDTDERSAATIISRKRNLRFLNYKSLKGGSGFAAHLAKHVNFKKPSVLIDSWHVETKMHAVTLEDKEQMHQFEAFSTEEDEDNQGLGTIAFLPFKKRKKSQDLLEQAVIQHVKASGEAGITLAELMETLRSSHEEELLRERSTLTPATVGRCLNALVDDGALLCVNAYFDQRFIVKDHGDVWLLRPFSLVTSSSSIAATNSSNSGSNHSMSVPRVVFEGEKDTLSFPWLKMDGSTNYKFLFSIQRKLLSYIIVAPGITEQSVYLKMGKLLTLQDTREALALLVEEGLVYIRGTTLSDGNEKPSLFSKKRNRSECTSTRVVNLVGNVLNFDRSKFVVHYFPHLECIQRFGSIVQDYQNEVAEFHRT